LPCACRLGVLIPREKSNAVNRLITSTAIPARAVRIEALANLTASFESFSLPLRSWLWSSSPSRLARLLILLHLYATRCPQLHRQARRLGSPSNLSHRPRPAQTGPPVPALECGSRRLGGAGGAGCRGTPSPTAPTTPKATATGPRPLRAGPGSGGTTPRSGQLDNEIIFLCEDDEDDANEASPPFNSSSRRATPTRPSDRNAPKLPPSLQSENLRTGRSTGGLGMGFFR
jgi:hypothetical protein